MMWPVADSNNALLQNAIGKTHPQTLVLRPGQRIKNDWLTRVRASHSRSFKTR